MAMNDRPKKTARAPTPERAKKKPSFSSLEHCISHKLGCGKSEAKRVLANIPQDVRRMLAASPHHPELPGLLRYFRNPPPDTEGDIDDA